MNWSVDYNPAVLAKDLPALSREVQKNIMDAIDKKLATHPDKFGNPLLAGLAGYRKLRIGDYRVIFGLMGRTVVIPVIAHRRDVYEEAYQRME